MVSRLVGWLSGKREREGEAFIQNRRREEEKRRCRREEERERGVGERKGGRREEEKLYIQTPDQPPLAAVTGYD